MRWTLKVVLFAAALFATASSWAFVPPPETAPAKPMARTVRILFIGNSYTYFNDLPSLFAAFAKATYPNLDVVVDSVTQPGESLKGHWTTGEAQRKISSGPWDYVVLQEHGAMSAGSFLVDGAVQRERPDEFFDYGGRFVKAVVAAKAKPVLYQTHETRSGREDMAYLDYAYMTLGQQSGALVAPSGRVWHRVHSTQDVNLYAEDGAHPSIYGSYLVAATLAATLFGDVPEAGSIQHPAALPDKAARDILAALRAVRAEIPASGYASVTAPAFVKRPSLESTLALDDPALAGTWSARDSKLQLSLGTQLSLTFDGKAPKVEMIDYTLNAAFSLPIKDFRVDGNVIRFSTSSQNRTYHLQVARRPEGLEMLIEQPRGRNTEFSHVNYRRDEASADFEFLTRQFAQISSKPNQESFDAALLSHYEALPAVCGPDRLAKILQGGSPLSSPWWTILTGWEYDRRNQYDEALRFLTFATHQFPKSATAFQNLSEGFEKAGRIEEAYKSILQAEALLSPKDEPVFIEMIQKEKARLQKLKPAA